MIDNSHLAYHLTQNNLAKFMNPELYLLSVIPTELLHLKNQSCLVMSKYQSPSQLFCDFKNQWKTGACPTPWECLSSVIPSTDGDTLFMWESWDWLELLLLFPVAGTGCVWDFSWTQGCYLRDVFAVAEQGLFRAQAFPASQPTPAVRSLGVTGRWERTQTGQLTQTDPRDVLHH